MSPVRELALLRLSILPTRAEVVLRDLRAWNSKSRKIEEWREEQLRNFLTSLIRNARELESAIVDKQTPRIAWVTRNLLELAVWVQYCNSSNERAQRFAVDSARDFFGLSKAFKGFFAGQNVDFGTIDKLEGEFKDAIKQEFGITEVDEEYERVSKAAKDVGFARFQIVNKICSKFAHPTAWLVSTQDNPEQEEAIRTFLITEGARSADEARDSIRGVVPGFSER
jgi:hypothetical protein